MLIELAENGWVPDAGIRIGIRQLLKKRLEQEASFEDYRGLLAELKASEIAIETDAANDQHYELPADFFVQVLGKHLKYSSCYWQANTSTLDDAELEMLKLYAQRAELEDGQVVVDLGCGWGSFSLWAAQAYPNSRFIAVSNSHGQREFIEAQAAARNLGNLEVRTCDINDLDLTERADRIVTVEMLEHVRNYQSLFERMSGWLKPGGKLFVHIFCNRSLMYPYVEKSKDDWMTKYFFTGGLMPAADTLLHFQEKLHLEDRWQLSGTHYAKTCRAWLEKLDERRDQVRAVLADAYGEAEADRWTQRWRMFFMSCEELFAYDGGREWMVCHYRFVNRV